VALSSYKRHKTTTDHQITEAGTRNPIYCMDEPERVDHAPVHGILVEPNPMPVEVEVHGRFDGETRVL
jgi:hypothetical protein